MNCDKAREIIDLAMSDEEHHLVEIAREHVRECASCREWQQSMSNAMGMLAALREPPVPDISAMVMNKLPAAHPASLRRESERGPLLRTLAWLGTGWILVILVATVALAALSQLVGSGWLPAFWGLGRTIADACGPVIVAGRTILDMGTAYIAALAKTSAAWGIPLLWFLFIDFAVLAALFLALRRRTGTISACFI